MTVSNSIRVIVARHQAGVTDRDTATEQIRVVLEQTKVDPAELLLVVSDGDLKQIAELQAQLAGRR